MTMRKLKREDLDSLIEYVDQADEEDVREWGSEFWSRTGQP